MHAPECLALKNKHNRPAVTNARINGDSGLQISAAVYSSTLASLLGLGWSKDNLRLVTTNQPGVTQADVEVQVLLAALSLGPVGLADQLEGYPGLPAAGAQVETNLTLAMSLTAANGMLLRPSFPLTPLGLQLSGSDFGRPFEAANGRSNSIGSTVGSISGGAGGGAGASGGGSKRFTPSSPVHTPPPAAAPTAPYNGWATYTSVKGGDGNSGEGLLFWTVVSFSFGNDPKNWPADSSHQLEQSSLAELVDAEHLPPAAFADIPLGAYRGGGGGGGGISSGSGGGGGDTTPITLPGKNGSQEYVWWRKGMAAAVPWVSGGTVPILFEHHPQQTNIAPVLPNGAVLLGEAGKATAVSTYRFLEVAADGATVTLQGQPGERIRLLLAHTADRFAVVERTAVIGGDGTAIVETTA